MSGDRSEYLAAYRAANAERIRQRNAEYREKNREALRAKSREYTQRTNAERRDKYKKNPEPAKHRAAAWQRQNAERVLEKNRAWREANPDAYRAHMKAGAARRRSRMSAAATFRVTAKDMRRLLAGPCAVTCCTNTDIQADHIVPISRGGNHGIGNLQPLCQSHNASKGARTWVEFRAYLARLAQAA